MSDNPAPRQGWPYGIRHQPDHFEDMDTPLEYHVFWPDPQPDHVVEEGSE